MTVLRNVSLNEFRKSGDPAPTICQMILFEVRSNGPDLERQAASVMNSTDAFALGFRARFRRKGQTVTLRECRERAKILATRNGLRLAATRESIPGTDPRAPQGA